MSKPIVLSLGELKNFKVENHPFVTRISADAWLKRPVSYFDSDVKQLNLALRLWILAIFRELAEESEDVSVLRHCIKSATVIPGKGGWKEFFNLCDPPIQAGNYIAHALEYLLECPYPEFSETLLEFPSIQKHTQITESWPPRPMTSKEKDKYFSLLEYNQASVKQKAPSQSSSASGYDNKPRSRKSSLSDRLKFLGPAFKAELQTQRTPVSSDSVLSDSGTLVTDEALDREKNLLSANQKRLIELSKLKKENDDIRALIHQAEESGNERINYMMQNPNNLPHFLTRSVCTALLSHTPGVNEIADINEFSAEAITTVNNWALKLILQSELYDASLLNVNQTHNPLRIIENKLDSFSQFPDGVMNKLEYITQQMSLLVRRVVSVTPAPMSENVLLPNSPIGPLDSDTPTRQPQGPRSTSNQNSSQDKVEIPFGTSTITVSRNSLLHERYLRSLNNNPDTPM